MSPQRDGFWLRDWSKSDMGMFSMHFIQSSKVASLCQNPFHLRWIAVSPIHAKYLWVPYSMTNQYPLR